VEKGARFWIPTMGSFNPTLVRLRLLPGYEYILVEVIGFNPTLVRLRQRRWGMGYTASRSFNPTLVRLRR